MQTACTPTRKHTPCAMTHLWRSKVSSDIWMIQSFLDLVTAIGFDSREILTELPVHSTSPPALEVVRWRMAPMVGDSSFDMLALLAMRAACARVSTPIGDAGTDDQPGIASRSSTTVERPSSACARVSTPIGDAGTDDQPSIASRCLPSASPPASISLPCRGWPIRHFGWIISRILFSTVPTTLQSDAI